MRRGPSPQWIREVTDFTASDLLPGSTVLALHAPILAGRFYSPEQSTLLSSDEDKSALSYVANAVRELSNEQIDGEHLDGGVLESLARLSPLTANGVDINVSSVSEPSGSFVIDRVITERAAEWKKKTPTDRKVFVSGTLESIQHSGAAFSLVGVDDSRIRGYLQHQDLVEKLRDLWGKEVTVEGRASYNSSGKIRLVEAISIRPYQTGDELVMSHVGRTNEPLFTTTPGLSGPDLLALRGTLSSDEPIDDLLKDL